MIFRRWLKSKFIFWQPRYNNLLTEKKNSKKIYVFEALVFLKTYYYCQSQESSDLCLGQILHGQIQLFE